MRTTCTAIRLMITAQHGSRSIERRGMDHGGAFAVGNAPSGHTLMQTWINKVALTLFADRVSVEATGVRPTMWAR